MINRAAAIQKPIQKFSLIYRDHQWQYRSGAFRLMIAVGFYLTKTYFRLIESLQKSHNLIKTLSELSEMNGILECFGRFERNEWNKFSFQRNDFECF